MHSSRFNTETVHLNPNKVYIFWKLNKWSNKKYIRVLDISQDQRIFDEVPDSRILSEIQDHSLWSTLEISIIKTVSPFIDTFPRCFFYLSRNFRYAKNTLFFTNQLITHEIMKISKVEDTGWSPKNLSWLE